MLNKTINLNDIVYFSKFDKGRALQKFASAAQVKEGMIQRAKEVYDAREFKRNVVFVGLAVTDWEGYGPNDNGDSFMSESIPGLLDAHQTLPANYKTFEKGKAYRFHQSQDTKNSIGKIHYAYYNAKQRRVELIIELFWDKAPTECLQIKRNKALNLSMGTGVEYDICSVCSKIAKTEPEHCDHIRYQLMDIVEGVPVHMINAKPNFNDISVVIIPGDQNAKVMYTVPESDTVGSE